LEKFNKVKFLDNLTADFQKVGDNFDPEPGSP
jgi:hypothetical protein